MSFMGSTYLPADSTAAMDAGLKAAGVEAGVRALFTPDSVSHPNWGAGNPRPGTFARFAVLPAALCLLAPLAARAAEEPAGGEHGGMILPPTVWAILSFLVVLVILTKKLFPPIFAAMDKRAAEIRDALDAAAKARAEAAEMMSRHQADLARARQESAEIVEEAKRDALKLKDHIVESARKEAEEITARSRREIELAKHTALDDLHRRAIDLSFDLASRLIKKNLSHEDHKELIKERLAQVPEFRGN